MSAFVNWKTPSNLSRFKPASKQSSEPKRTCSALLDGFEELRAELDRRLSILTWLHTGRLIHDEYLEAVKSAIASCYVLPRDEDAVTEWRKAVAVLENDADKGPTRNDNH